MSSRCTNEVDPDAERSDKSVVRASRVGKWRTAVLVLVHVAIIAHVLQWQLTGSTISPIEPSEATDLAEHGRINAGAIFFAITILGTAVFGRWFCGWACHLVALQDGCRWLLMRLGLRPRPIQLGVLGLVPLITFVYMFLGPWVYRTWHQLVGPEQIELHLTTEKFWATFPGVTMIVATVTACGFAMVYFLGAKGFCTYGCPYGAIFGVVDQLAAQRIRVTDACEGCGHCTSVCSSNVRVHQEVRDFGAVVDPGCMKCLDCVSVCPKGALYVGWGAPALATRPRRAQSVLARARRAGGKLASIAFAAAFVFASFVVLLQHRGTFDFGSEVGFVAVMAAGSTLIAVVFAGRSTRIGGPTWSEEVIVALAFLGSLFVLRGYRPFAGLVAQYGERFAWMHTIDLAEGVPLLLALGLAVLIAYAALLGMRLLVRSDVSMQHLALRVGGKVTPAGWGFVLAMVAVAGVTGHAVGLRREIRRGEELELARAEDARAATSAFNRGIEHANAGRLEQALAEFEVALKLRPEFVEARENLAGMLCALGRFADGIAQYRLALGQNPDDPDTHALLGRALAVQGELDLAAEHWTESLRLNPDHALSHQMLSMYFDERGDAERARFHAEAARRAGAPAARRAGAPLDR